MEIRSKRNGKIELLRFIMAIIVVIHHSYVVNLAYLADQGDRLFPRGSLAVEFFFLVSGYLMAFKCSKNDLNIPIGQDTTHFIVKKYLSLQPNLFITEVIALIVCFFVTPFCGFKDLILRFFGMLSENFLLQDAGIKIYELNPVTWYLSAMLLAMLILYPLCRKYFDVFSRIIAPFIGFLIIGMFYLKFKGQTGPFNKLFDNYFYKGLFRAIAEICLGVVAFDITKWLKSLKLKKFSRFLFSCVELSFYALVIVFMTIETTMFDTIALLLLLVAVSLSFSQVGIASKLFDNKLFCFLGSLSLPIYLSHYFWLDFINEKFETASFNYKLVIYLIVSGLTAIIVYFLSNFLKKNVSFFKKLFIQTET